MSEETKEQKIERLKEELDKAQAKTPEPPKEELPKEETPKTSPEEIKAFKDELKKNGLKNAKIVSPPPVYANERPGDFATVITKGKYIPPDPLAHITGMNIQWIDNRYQIHGVPGIPGGNIITLRSMGAVEKLIDNLKYAKEHFIQEEMISTKKPRILPKKTCIYLNEEGKCTNEHYFDGIKKEYTTKGRRCLFSNQDRCPQSD